MYQSPLSSWSFSRSYLQMLLVGFMFTVVVVHFSIIVVQEKNRNAAISMHEACIAHDMRVKIINSTVISSSLDAMDKTEIWLAGSTVKVCQLANSILSRVGYVNGSLYAILTPTILPLNIFEVPCCSCVNSLVHSLR